MVTRINSTDLVKRLKTDGRYLVHRIDAVAKAQRLSRSAFLAKAAEREMAEA